MNAHVRNCASGMIAFAAASAAFPVCAFADEGAGINAILPQMEEFIPMLVAFIILWIVLAKFGWPLFEGMLNKREETIKNSLEKSEEARQESERLLAEYREQLEGAKTQAQQILNNAKLTGAPTGFTMEVREVRLAAGAGFVVVICGSIMTMPGLPKKPAAVGIDVDADGKITGLF